MAQQPTPALQGIRTLIVEDEPASARLLAELLTDAGCDVQIAASAEDAFIALRTFKARLMILDLILPRMSGLMLARHLKRATSPNDIIIIAVSAMDDGAGSRLALEAGCAAFVPKPFDPLTFTATVARHLGRATHDAPTHSQEHDGTDTEATPLR